MIYNAFGQSIDLENSRCYQQAENKKKSDGENGALQALNVSQGVVSRLLKEHRETGSVKDRKRSRRQKATTPREDRLYLRMRRQNRFAPCETQRSKLRDTYRVSVFRRLVNSRLPTLH